MRIKGVCYDVGRVMGINWRPRFDGEQVRRELEIIKDDLHCSSVRIHGRDLTRLTTAADYALNQGLEVWFSPEEWDKSPADTLAYLTKAAQEAESLRQRWPDRIVFVLGGELTPRLHKVPVGGEITLRKIAKGRFTLDLQSGHKNHLLLCTVTGIAPFISYARTLYKDWKENRLPADINLYLINGASRSWEFGYREEVERIAAEVPWLTYVPTISRPWEDPDWRGEVGRVEEIIRKYSDQWGLTGADTTGYLCGHPDMIEMGKGVLKRRGFAKEHLKEEVYWIPAKETSA